MQIFTRKSGAWTRGPFYCLTMYKGALGLCSPELRPLLERGNSCREGRERRRGLRGQLQCGVGGGELKSLRAAGVLVLCG